MNGELDAGGSGDLTASISAGASLGAGASLSAQASFSASASLSAGASVSASASFSAGFLGARKDPLLGFRFAVEIEGLVTAGFSDVTGLHGEIEVQQYREGGVNAYMHQRAGPVKYTSNLTLKKGILSDSRELWNWYCNVAQGNIQRKNVSVVLLDEQGSEKIRWNLLRAYPVKWTGPDLHAMTSEIAFETVELAHHGIVNG